MIKNSFIPLYVHQNKTKKKKTQATGRRAWLLSHTLNFIAPIFYTQRCEPCPGVWCFPWRAEVCWGRQKSRQRDSLRQCQMLKPNCLYPPRYCITCSRRAAATVISPLALICLNHLDRQMALHRSRASTMLYINLETHITADINSSCVNAKEGQEKIHN